MKTAIKRIARLSRSSRLDLSFGELGKGDDGAAERAHLLTVLERLVSAIARRSDLVGAADNLYHFVCNNAQTLGLAMPDKLAEVDCLDELPRRERQAVLRDLHVAFPDVSRCKPSRLDRRLDFLARSMGLSPVDRAVLGVIARRSIYSIWQRLVEKIGDGSPLNHVPVVALMIGESEDEAYRAYSEKGNLLTKGLAEEDTCRSGMSLNLHDFVRRFVNSDANTEAEMIRELIPVAPRTALDAESYGHMRADLARAQRLVAHSLQSGDRANILLYGVPGTGKTEFARLLADGEAATAISVGEADEEGSEPTRRERLAHLAVCRKIVANMGTAVLVIDEAEDLFLAGMENRGSKLWLNKLVEDGKGPHVWIVNDPRLLGEPVIRRMDMAIRFDMPPASARRSIVERLVKREGAALATSEEAGRRLVTDLAELNTSPAILSTAMRTGARVGEALQGVVSLARDLAEASGRLPAAANALDGAEFDPALSVANCDLVALADKLVCAKTNWSLLLSGPPGTGKSAYARFLAQRAGIDLICVSGSELLGAYVGETEKQIAASFAHAERHGSLLLIDEADSFLTNRDLAQRNWEVSMTNEMLRQMERGRVRFIATTNRAATLDPASARRFTLHADFAVMDASRAQRLFEVSFVLPAPENLHRVVGLTPGDFAQVRQRAALLGEVNPTRLVEWLATAVNAREGNKTKLGF